MFCVPFGKLAYREKKEEKETNDPHETSGEYKNSFSSEYNSVNGSTTIELL